MHQTFRDVFVFVLLSVGEVVAFVKQCGKVPLISCPITGQDQADTTPSNIPKSRMKAHEISAAHHINPRSYAQKETRLPAKLKLKQSVQGSHVESQGRGKPGGP